MGLTALVASGGMPAGAAAAPQPLGEWRFAEGSGQVALDSGPLGLDGRLGAEAGADATDPIRIDGIADGALRFGAGAFVRIPEAPELAVPTVSVEAVVRAPASPGAYSYVVSRGARECWAGSYGLYTGADGGMAFYVFDGRRFVLSPAARVADVWDGGWHHVTGTFDGTTVRLFVDGRLVGQPVADPVSIDYGGTSASAAFGRYVGNCELPFSGDIDLVRLTGGALSPVAIATASAEALRRPTAPASLPEAAPAGSSPAGAPPAQPPATEPGAPPRACRMVLSRRRIPAGRATVVAVRVTVRGLPAAAVRVRASQRGRHIAGARTSGYGDARLTMRVRRPGKVRIHATTSPACRTAFVRVRR